MCKNTKIFHTIKIFVYICTKISLLPSLMKDVIIKLFVILTLVFAYVITSRTPMMWEDVVYTLKADAALGKAMSNSSVADTLDFQRYERVNSFEDLAASSYYHYMNANGRLFPHMTSQTFGTLIGKSFFNVLNAIMLILLVCLVTLLVTGNKVMYWQWWVVVLSALWFLMPETNTCLFLMTYALNYLWSTTICAAFLLFYFSLNRHQLPQWLLFFGFVFAFGAGWSHEGVAVGIAAALFFDNLLALRSHQLNNQKVIWAVFFCLGVAFLCLSPGNFTRTDAALPLYNHLLSFARLKVFWILLVCWLVLSRDWAFITKNRFLVIALLAQSAFMFYVGFRNNRVLWGTEFLSLILLLRLFYEKWSMTGWLTSVSYFCLVLLSFHFCWLAYRSDKVRDQYDEVISLYMKSSDGQVNYDITPEHALVMKYIPTPLCKENAFELFTFSLYYTHDNKRLIIIPNVDLNNQKHD